MAARSVEFINVSFVAAGGRRILDDVSLRVEPGGTTALLGRSGSGKTTLLRTVNALVRPSSGTVRVGDADVSTADTLVLRRSVGYVIQETGLFPHLTIAKNVRLPLEISGRFGGREDELQQQVERALLRVGLPPAQFGGRFPHQLSGGQRQRAGVARALVTAPSVLLMDEPFGALDPLTRAEMQDMLGGLLADAAITTLIVTHDLDEALYLADTVVLLEDGKVVAEGTSAEFARMRNPAVEAYVRAARRVSAA